MIATAIVTKNQYGTIQRLEILKADGTLIHIPFVKGFSLRADAEKLTELDVTIVISDVEFVTAPPPPVEETVHSSSNSDLFGGRPFGYVGSGNFQAPDEDTQMNDKIAFLSHHGVTIQDLINSKVESLVTQTVTSMAGRMDPFSLTKE